VHKARVEGLRFTLGYDYAFLMSSSDRKGGIVIFCNKDHIDAIISVGGGEPWRLTCVYGEVRTHLHFKMWDILKFIKASYPHPRMCIGDFNEVLHRSEHEGVQEQSLA
jgi:hypothetical protein